MAGALPTVLVLTAIGALAVWGHHSGWKVPKFAHVAGSAEAKPKEDWCEQHAVPDSRCIKCHPDLVGANMKDWCPEHGVPESKCTLCHPELLTTGVAGDWCPEHGIPETSCTLCHPEIAVRSPAPPSETGATLTLDPRVPRPATGPSTAPSPTPSAVAALPAAPASGTAATKPASKIKDPKTCQTHALRVQFASIQAVRKAGVKVGTVVERPMSAVVSANAASDYDRDRFAQISLPLAGGAWRVEKQAGQRVRRGEALALIDAADVGRAKAELLQAVAALDLKTKAGGRLLAHTFGTAQVTVRESLTAIVVPVESLQWEGCCHIVFARLTDDIFQVRKVKLGAKANGFAEVTIGVLPGEVVATAGSHVLKSEVLKRALGPALRRVAAGRAGATRCYV